MDSVSVSASIHELGIEARYGLSNGRTCTVGDKGCAEYSWPILTLAPILNIPEKNLLSKLSISDHFDLRYGRRR